MGNFQPMRRGLAAVLALVTALAVGACAGRGPMAGPIALNAQSAESAGMGTANLVVQLPEIKALQDLAGKKHVQAVDLAKAVTIGCWVTGAGINGWAGLNTTTFGAPDANGIRTATFSGNVAAGARRVFRVEIRDNTGWSYKVLEELWGVADIQVGKSTTVTLSRATTPVGKIFRTLLATREASKALAVPVADVQTFVDKLLNTDSATGAALDGTQPQINYSLLNIDMAASAIAVGDAGVPYTVPATIPASLTPTPVRESSVRVKVVDIKGQPVTNESVVFLDDQASPVIRTTPGQALDVNFDHVTPGTWTVTAVDTVSGRTVTSSVTAVEKQAKTVSVMMPLQSVDVLVGAYNLAGNGNCWPGYSCGFNGDNLHPTMIQLNDPRRVAVHNGVLYFVDNGNHRICSLDLASNTPVVKTVAGNGTAATAVAAEGSNANQVPIGITVDCHLGFDEAGNLLFGEESFGRVAKVDVATGLLTTAVSLANLTGVDATWSPRVLTYDPARKHMYLGVWKRWTGQKLYDVDMATYPAATSIVKVNDNLYPNGMTFSGNYLFYSANDANGYQIRRRDVRDASEVYITAKNRLNNNTDGSPAQDFYQTDRWGGSQPYSDFTIDPQGNLYCFGYQGAMRITDVLNGADGANTWLVNYLNFSGSGLAADPVTGNLYFTGSGPVPDPNGGGNVNVQSVNVVKL